MSKPIKVNYIPYPLYQENKEQYNCYLCTHNDYNFKKPPCAYCVHGYGSSDSKNYHCAKKIN